MSIRNVVTRGYGPGASIAFLVTRGYTPGEAVAVTAGAAPSLRKRGKRYEFITDDGKRISGSKEEVERFMARYHESPKAEIVEVEPKPVTVKPEDTRPVIYKSGDFFKLPELPPLKFDADQWASFGSELSDLGVRRAELEAFIVAIREDEDIVMLLMAA